MLLKLQDPRTHAWHYIDGIQHAKVYPRSSHELSVVEEREDRGTSIDRLAVMRVDSREDLAPGADPGAYEVHPVGLILCTEKEWKNVRGSQTNIRLAELQLSTGETKMVAWTGLAFLLNDQGQTVERL